MNNELIKISTDNNGQQAVSAKELYAFLTNDKTQFSRWAKNNITENDYADEGMDYIVLDTTSKTSKGGRPSQDYALTLDFAKELSMMSHCEKGKQARQYFISCEKQLKQKTPMSQLEILAGATQALLQHEQQLQALQERAEASEQKVTNIESKLNNLIELQSIDAADDNWRAATDYVVNTIARQAMNGDYQAARRESYQELRQKYTQVIKTMAARYQIDFDYNGSNDDDDDFILTVEEENALNLSIAASV